MLIEFRKMDAIFIYKTIHDSIEWIYSIAKKEHCSFHHPGYNLFFFIYIKKLKE